MSARPFLMHLPNESWMEGPVACKGEDPALFFPPDGHFLLIRRAIEICNTCPSQLQCLDYALTHRIDDGIWGGTGRNERRRILRGRKDALRLANDPEPPEDLAHG